MPLQGADRKPIVFVLGAGASAPFGFPLGSALSSSISNWILSDRHLPEMHIFPSDPLVKAKKMARRLKSTETSIDIWLNQNQDFTLIAKYCIARFIACNEKPSQLEGHWYGNLWRALVPDTPKARADQLYEMNDVAFITFNYDRSLEQSLMQKTVDWFGVSEEEAAEVLNKIHFVHVYGQLGLLKWQRASSGSESMFVRDYIPEYDPEALLYGLGSIKMIHEVDLSSASFVRARELLLASARIHFLGCGYHPLNLERIKFGAGTSSTGLISGTHFGLTDVQRDTLHRSGAQFGMPINLFDHPQTLEEYVRERIHA